MKIKNTHEDVAVGFYMYQHEKDGFAHTEKSHWMGNIMLGPCNEERGSGSIYIYDDEDADDPLMSIPEKIAGVYDIPECAEEKQDESYFEQVAVPIVPVCPME